MTTIAPSSPSADLNHASHDAEPLRLQRWRLILGPSSNQIAPKLMPLYEELDDILGSLYRGSEPGRRGGDLSSSAPRVARWLGDIRKYFPKQVVQVMQKDAFDRLGLGYMLGEPELLESVEVDVHLVATLISLKNFIPEKTKATARMIVQKLVDDVMKRVSAKTVSAVTGAISRANRTNRPRYNELDFDRTIRLNLKNWNADQKKLVVDRLAGYGHKRRSLYDVVLCVDQSGSMASSVVYSSIFAATLAKLPALSTRLVLFDTKVVDMSEMLSDPVDLLFGAQLGGGTDIGQALTYCRSIITRPDKTILILISDLYEGGKPNVMLSTAREIIRAGVKTICLLALDDNGAPAYDQRFAAAFANMGAPTFACTPDLFPELISAAINGRDVGSWANEKGLAPREKLAATDVL